MNSKGNSAAGTVPDADRRPGLVAPRLAGVGGAHDGRGGRIGELAVGAGADPEVVTEGPVVEIVAALPAGVGIGRHFIVRRGPRRSSSSAQAASISSTLSSVGSGGGWAPNTVPGSMVR